MKRYAYQETLMHTQSSPRQARHLPPTDINIDNSQQLLTAFMDALQSHFKKDTAYIRPLISPQINTIFALDKDLAIRMTHYMEAKLTQCCGFQEGEFRITHRAGVEEGGLQRLRLEFPDGITFEIIRRISEALKALEEAS